MRKKGNKKEGKNKAGIGRVFLKNKFIRTMLFRHASTKEFARLMEPRARPEAELEKIWEKRIGIIVVLIISAVLMWFICFTADPPQSRIKNGNYLSRVDDEEDITLHVSGESDEGNWEKSFTFNVPDRKFTKEEKEKIEKRTDEYVRKTLPGKNTSLESVDKKLNLVGSVPGTGVTLEYEFDDRYLRNDGTLITKNIPNQGVDTEIGLIAKWKNYKGQFHYTIHLLAPDVPAIKTVISQARSKIKKSIKSQPESKVIELPKEYIYEEEVGDKNYIPVFLIVGAFFCMPFVWRSQEKNKISARQEQLMNDHPGFINKIMLLLGAGLTLRYAIERISGEYERELKEGGEKHYVYEELCVTMQELKDGVGEGQAIENFGKRCRCMPYMRFSSVVTQNLRKGAEGILAILEKEASDSLLERKQAALRRGEVAGTKLLFPMMVMLGLVMGIIMVPAFMSM